MKNIKNFWGLFSRKKRETVNRAVNYKAHQEFLETKKKVDDYMLLKFKETRDLFFFNDVMDILTKYKAISIENRKKLMLEFLKRLESILTADEKILFSQYYEFEQFKLKVFNYFIKEVETLNILLKTNSNTGLNILMDFTPQDKNIFEFLRNQWNGNTSIKPNDKYVEKIFKNFNLN